jgi:hypothetical protein
MTLQTSITLPLHASAWQAVFARVEKSAGIFRNVAKRYRRPSQGCFSMTD